MLLRQLRTNLTHKQQQKKFDAIVMYLILASTQMNILALHIKESSATRVDQSCGKTHS